MPRLRRSVKTWDEGSYRPLGKVRLFAFKEKKFSADKWPVLNQFMGWVNTEPSTPVKLFKELHALVFGRWPRTKLESEIKLFFLPFCCRRSSWWSSGDSSGPRTSASPTSRSVSRPSGRPSSEKPTTKTESPLRSPSQSKKNNSFLFFLNMVPPWPLVGLLFLFLVT